MAAGMEFCQKHISVDSAKKEVILPEIFHKYASDFGMPKDELFIWLFQYLSKDTRMKLLELMERKTTIIYTPSSTIPQTLPSASSSLAPPYSGSILGSSPTSVIGAAPASSSAPLVRNDSAAAIERYSNRVRSSTMGVPKPTTPPISRPLAREESSPTPLYATVSETKFTASLPHARVQPNTLATVTSPSFFDEQHSPRTKSSLLANARSESAASVLMTPASSSPSLTVPPVLPTSASSPQLGSKPPGPTRTASQTSILSSPGVHSSHAPPLSLPHLSPATSPTRSPAHPGRTIERSVSAFTLSSSPPTPPSLWPTSAPGSPDPIVAAQRMAFTASPTPLVSYTTPPTTPSKPTVSSPAPMFLGCVDYYQLISPTKAPSGTSPTPLSTTSTPPPEPLANTTTSTTPATSTFAPVPMSSEPVSPRSVPVTTSPAVVPKGSAPVPASPTPATPKPKPMFKEPELAGLEPSKVKPTKMKSTSTMNPSTGKALSKSPSLSSSASASSIMSTKPLSSSPSAPSLATTSTSSGQPRKLTRKTPSPSPAPPVAPTPVSPRSTPNQIEPLKQEMVAKLQEIAVFLRANMDTANRDVDYVMGLAQLLTYMKKQLESPLHTTTGKLLYRTHSSLSIDPTKQETLISSVSKAVRLLRDKVNEYKKSIESENETMAVYMLKNICLCDIKEAVDTFKTKFPTTST
eukprot:Phypoly_transcript_00529.p2 GENE.Phypoly_transcript_00529~~Phypoly_transcript_00529.p2  ORF type:complete len:692 (+),score=191.37 Phypoly_transcript_00529:2381-4456(+)